MSLNCTTDKYPELYARWLINPGKLLDLGKLKPGQKMIDLCGGSGIVAQEAAKRGASVALVADLNPRLQVDDVRMIPPIWGRAETLDTNIRQHIEKLHWIAAHVGPDYTISKAVECLGERCHCHRLKDFDLVVCRQGIGYLDPKKTARAVANVLRVGGKFVVNNFVRPKWALKSYLFEGKRFFEASGFVGRSVFHLQASPKIGVDLTKFRWHTEAELAEAFKPFFCDVKVTRTDKTLYFVCTK